MTRIVSTKSAHSKINYKLKKYSLRHMHKNKIILDTLWYKISPLSESAVGSNSIIISNQLNLLYSQLPITRDDHWLDNARLNNRKETEKQVINIFHTSFLIHHVFSGNIVDLSKFDTQ